MKMAMKRKKINEEEEEEQQIKKKKKKKCLLDFLIGYFRFKCPINFFIAAPTNPQKDDDDGDDEPDRLSQLPDSLIAKILSFLPIEEAVRTRVLSKRWKKNQKPKPDHLSELPDVLISKILSLLPIEEAVRTGVLSTRWKSLWNYVEKIVINHIDPLQTPYTERETRSRKFISSVDSTLMQCVHPKTVYLHKRTLMSWVRPKTFHVIDKSPEDHFLYGLLHKWLQRLYSLNVVESLIVDIPWLCYAPPEWFYHNSKLVKMHISSWDFTTNLGVGVDVSWTSLKSLSLHRVLFGDEQLAKILSGCPLLEDLSLDDLRSGVDLNIMSPRLVKLSVGGVFYRFESKVVWEINAPWLQSLNLSGFFNRAIVRLTNVSSLVHANLSFCNEDDLQLGAASKVLEKVDRVHELTIHYAFILALSEFKLSGKPCPLFKCKRLTLIMPIYKHELPGITYVLQNSRHLETLVIEVRKYLQFEVHMEVEERCEFDPSVYLSRESGDFPHLKSIEVAYCKSSCDFYCLEYHDDDLQDLFVFELIACIIRKAPALEKLAVATRENCCEFKKCSINSEDACMLSHKLRQLLLDRKQVVEYRKVTKQTCFEFIF